MWRAILNQTTFRGRVHQYLFICEVLEYAYKRSRRCFSVRQVLFKPQKKLFSLVALPLRPYPPPPSSLVAPFLGEFFWYFFIASKKMFFSFLREWYMSIVHGTVTHLLWWHLIHISFIKKNNISAKFIWWFLLQNCGVKLGF